MRLPSAGFRTKLLLLTAAVAVLAAGATALITVRQARTQVIASAAVEQQDVATIKATLADAGALRSEWAGLRGTVDTLAKKTGQRVRVTVGDEVVDSDTLRGGPARSLSGEPPLTVDPRPVPDYTGVPATDRYHLTLEAIADYRRQVNLADCLTDGDTDFTVTHGLLGVPAVDFDRLGSGEVAAKCAASALKSDPDRPPEVELFKIYYSCVVPGSSSESATTKPPEPSRGSDRTVVTTTEESPFGDLDDVPCLQQAFRRMDATPVPPPLSVALGVGDQIRTEPISLWPALLAAAVVAIVAIAGTVLLSRRVMRPVIILTAAARRLRHGDLSWPVPVRGNDEIAELATSFNRMAGSLRDSREQQRTMVAGIAHELRTPLANIRGYLEALKDGVLQPDKALFVSLYEEAVLQQRLIDDLQDLAQAESGTMIYHRTRLDVADLLATCRTAHSAAAEAAGVRLEVYVYQRPSIDGDQDRLRQVLGNLITNAIRATPRGGTVRLRAQPHADTVTIEVADTGHGITAEDLPHVFDRFWRADNARSRATGGSGLGLSIAREIVGAHNGTLTVDSAPGTGTTFTVTFPA